DTPPEGCLPGRRPARPGADAAGPAVAGLEGYPQAGLLDGLVGGGRRKPRVAVDVQDDLVALEVPEAGLVVEIFDLSGDQDLEVFHGEAAERPDTDPACLATRPEVRHPPANPRHPPHAGDNDAARYARSYHRSWYPVLKAGGSGKEPATLSLGGGGPGALDQAAHPFHHRANGLEIRRFLIGIVGDFNAKGIFDIKHDHR